MNESPEWFRRRRVGLSCWHASLVAVMAMAVMSTGIIELDASAAANDGSARRLWIPQLTAASSRAAPGAPVPTPKAPPAATPAPSAKDAPAPTPMRSPSDVKAASEARTPAYTPGEGEAYPRIRYSDEQVSVNDRCPVRKAKLNLKMDPIYVNGRPVGFC